ncbi:hypothetical protein C8R41DRAFT_923643 [Lentinula lateritia]|uniref:Zn(2)-C6 fungal-type domain-containing protein n=1 Tax=Lentinula lateritia TaxID=40482 RepID=A0ABQ8V6Q1_9AGAR|nr:hypothetical protein C8R41DRAFT_923643 [Lentinula lateritia]
MTAAAAAAKQKAEEEAVRKAVEEERAQATAREERRKQMAEAVTARSRQGTSPGEVSSSPRHPTVCHESASAPLTCSAFTTLLSRSVSLLCLVTPPLPLCDTMEVRRIRGKGKERVQAEAAGGNPNDGGDEEEDDEDDRAPCKRCRTKKISCQMQAGKKSSIICKPCHDAKVRCSYSGRPSIVKKEVGANPTSERLAILESQVAQLLADNRQLHDGQVKANTYHRHFNRKLDWLITDAARRRRLPPEMPEAGPSGLSRKRRRVVDSDEEEEMEMEMEKEKDGEGEEEEMAPIGEG